MKLLSESINTNFQDFVYLLLDFLPESLFYKCVHPASCLSSLPLYTLSTGIFLFFKIR